MLDAKFVTDGTQNTDGQNNSSILLDTSPVTVVNYNCSFS